MKVDEADDGALVHSASISVNHVAWGRIKKRGNQLESVWSTIFYSWRRKNKKCEKWSKNRTYLRI